MGLYSSVDAVGTVMIFSYYALTAALIILLSRVFRIPREVIRKTYHLMCSFSMLILLYSFERWWGAASAITSVFVLAYLVMGLLERIPAFGVILRDHNGREIRRQVLTVSFMFLLLLGLTWGVLGPDGRHHAVIGIMAWGVGDTLAALIGKRFGKIRPWMQRIAPRKTLEGFGAMLLSVALAIFLVLTILTGLSVWTRLLSSVLLAGVASSVELVSRKGWDTITVPSTITVLSMLLIPFLSHLLGS